MTRNKTVVKKSIFLLKQTLKNVYDNRIKKLMSTSEHRQLINSGPRDRTKISQLGSLVRKTMRSFCWAQKASRLPTLVPQIVFLTPCSSWQQVCKRWNPLVPHLFLCPPHFFRICTNTETDWSKQLKLGKELAVNRFNRRHAQCPFGKWLEPTKNIYQAVQLQRKWAHQMGKD